MSLDIHWAVDDLTPDDGMDFTSEEDRAFEWAEEEAEREWLERRER